MTEQCEVIELRRYRLVPGARETLIELFDREFIETQEAAGIRVIGQFRDLEEPDHFVWLRGFRDMDSRTRALGEFYGGPVWARHRDAANGAMINSDNVLLLRPARAGSGFSMPAVRPEHRTHGANEAFVVSTTCHLAPRTESAFAELFFDSVKPRLETTSARIEACLVTERAPNGFERLPVREGETVFVWFASFSTQRAWESHQSELERLGAAWKEVRDEMDRRVWCRPEVSKLVPTTRSLFPYAGRSAAQGRSAGSGAERT